MEDLELKVKVEVQEAEQNLDKIINKADEAKEHLEDINDTVDDGIPAVEGLDKAFESAFNSLSKEGSKGGAVLKKMFDSVKNAIPVVKNLNTTALTGLKGIKAALASLGIGLIVVALGEILAHWKDIVGWIGIGTQRQEEYTRAVEQSEAAMDRLNFQHEKEIRLLKAAGATNTEIAEAKVRQTEEDREQLDLLYLQNMAHTKGRKERKQLTEEYKKQTEEANKAVIAAKRELEIVKEEEKIRAQRAKEEEEERRRSGGSGVSRNLKETVEDSKATVVELKQYTGEAMSALESFAKNADNLLSKETQDWFVELLKPDSPRKTTEEVVKYIQIAYNEINKTIEKEEDKLKLSYQTYQGLLAGDAQTYKNRLEESISERRLMLATGRVSLEEDLKKELEIQKQAYADEEVLLTKRRDFLLENGIQGTEFEDITSQLAVLADERIAYIREQSRRIAEAVLEGRQEVIDQEEKNSQSDMKFFNLKDFNRIYDERLKAQQEYYKALMDSYDEGSQEYEKYKKLYEDITNQLNTIDKNRTQAMFQELDDQFQKWNAVLSSVSSVFSSVADMYEEDSKAILENAEARREAGKITEEEYQEEEKRSKEQFERAKALRISTTIVNTLAGAIGAFLQASAAYEPPYGQILGAATAAAVTAAGIAEIQKIKNTSFNSSNVGGSSPSANVGVTPIDVRDDIQQSPTVLANSQSPTEQQVFILQGDLEDSHRQVQIREGNTTF